MKKQSAVRWYAAAAAAVLLFTLLDQLSKCAAITCLKGKAALVLINQILEFRYLENRGMAFGLLQGKIWFFLLMCLLFFVGIVYVFIKIPKQPLYVPLAAVLTVLFSGALGNFLDRIYRGYVVDFIYFSIIDFPTFNLADIYVVCGGVSLVLLICFRYRDNDFDFLKWKSGDEN